ncbi:hypothetical protein BLA60_24715 [Actinophytocola xinjiangensis]|uniref:DUF3105 domain-containing protein n=1 Tax=Actinophytocola xinjiangensis TaxID=485602 RepID=A0A7Z1AXB4_9PSEU|nr:DUF3105 domain-containing protein [Actinophytocola xinjiangensis]OLF08073.1 hypothetical protein BLA60_24715 [Actinophytocola xinjiangensis]
MASGTKSKGTTKPKSKNGAKGRSRSSAGRPTRPKPWGTIAAVLAVVLLAGGVFTYAFLEINEKEQWVASEENPDPSENIDGVKREKYESGQHVTGAQRVAYDQSPPFGGPHDQAWAACSGVVYDTAVRTENMVHSLEHGSVWIAYNPDQVKGGDLDKLKGKVEGQPYMMMSPWPGLDKPISLQSWGHQLKLDKADDTRIDEFIRSLRENQYQNPEPGGRCDVDGTGFDPANPPPFVAEPPGDDAVKMDGTGAVDESAQEMQGQQVPPPATEGTAPPASEQPPAASGTGAPPPSQ